MRFVLPYCQPCKDEVYNLGVLYAKITYYQKLIKPFCFRQKFMTQEFQIFTNLESKNSKKKVFAEYL